MVCTLVDVHPQHGHRDQPCFPTPGHETSRDKTRYVSFAQIPAMTAPVSCLLKHTWTCPPACPMPKGI